MKIIDFFDLTHIIKENIIKKINITFHSIGDTDCVSSAFGLLNYLPNASISTPDVITSNSRRIMERLGFDESTISNKIDENAEMIILVDVNNFEDCGRFREVLENFDGQILIIDHHSPSTIDKDNVTVFNDESFNSTASIVYEILKSLESKVDKNLANLIATGIISDSAELKNAFPLTFVQIGELLEKAEIDYQSLLLEMRHINTPQNRAEFIRDLFKANVMITGNLLIVFGKAEIHANKLADDGIRIGADVSLFYTHRKEEVSFSARLRPPLDRTYKINLGKLMKTLAPIIEGQGGGHPCAAGAYGPLTENTSKFIDMFMFELNNHIKK
ncbi:MAG: DHH family phosphoesterase [Candidatus Micrarchaeaceae archaeon]|jgi:nanoRNase/pAp phosphatase (c-di-AMP/oligoRNAs hydrolase)